MSEIRVTIGADVLCSDGPCGRVHRLIVDPVDKRLTHLDVEEGVNSGRLVPGDQIAAGADEILLRCSMAEFARFEAAEEDRPVPWPYDPQDVSGRFPEGVEEVERDSAWGNVTTVRDRIPGGGLEVRRGEPVYATDGMAGRTRGISVELADRRLTSLILDTGHLWGRTTVSVPVGSVKRIGDGIQLDLSKEQVRGLADRVSHDDA